MKKLCHERSQIDFTPDRSPRTGASPACVRGLKIATLVLSSSACLLVSFARGPLNQNPTAHPVSSQAKARTNQDSRSDAKESNAARVVSLRLVPDIADLWGAHASQRFLVLGRDAAGLERDLTTDAKFVLADPTLAKLDADGRVVALAEGTTTLEGEVAGHTAKAEIRIQQPHTPRPFSFGRDIAGIFTKYGCNGSECHGGVKGRGGFKLSMDAMYPKEDYGWITKGGIYQVLSPESGGPKPSRIDVKNPEQSLLLLKPTMSIPHGGGLRFNPDSRTYQTILEWVRKGAPYGVENDAVERIDVFPPETVMEVGKTQQVLLRSHLANGRTEDVTDQARFETNNPEVVKVDAAGKVQAVGLGETSVIIRAATQAVSARFGVIASAAAREFPETRPRNYVDNFVFTKLRKFHIVPSEPSVDSEFLRRVCLDLTGMLPPPNRVREFLADNNPAKRDKVIDLLLGSPEYVDYFTFRFSDLFRVGGGVRTPPGSDAYYEWIRNSIAANKPYDQMARERIAAQGYDGPSRHFQDFGKVPPVEQVVSEDMRVFLGRRLDCAQCHNHPYDRWSQNQFWGLAAFYGRMTNTSFDNNLVMFDDPDGQEMNYGAMGETALRFVKIVNPRTKQTVEPRFFDGTVIHPKAREDPRLWLARRMTSHRFFAEAAVNRIWAYFFGRGLVDPVDDFRAGNPPSNPDLLNALAEDFEKHNYDLRYLIRTIVSSNAYQLSGRTNSSNHNDELNYSHAMPRPLDAEVLLDAITDATAIPVTFHTGGAGQAPKGTRAIQVRVPEAYPSHFLEVFGRPIRDSLPDRDGKASLAQALHMLVGSTYTDQLSKEGGRLDRLMKSGLSGTQITEELFLATLSRFPTGEERAELEPVIQKGNADRRGTFESLLWSLLASREFACNH
jgi:hypothetical protein